MRTFTTFLLAAVAVGTAQNYKCDWSVVGIGGGDMAGTAYRCGSTLGQTATGLVTGTAYWAFIGFWQADIQTGVAEEPAWPNAGPLVTRLYSPAPNPFRQTAAIRYSLAAPGRVSLLVHDLAGRAVRTLADGAQPPGRYSLTWNGRDDRGRRLGAGVYFVRMQAGDYRSASKLVSSR